MKKINKEKVQDLFFEVFSKTVFKGEDWLTLEDKLDVIEQSLAQNNLTLELLASQFNDGIALGYTFEAQAKVLEELMMSAAENREVKLSKDLKRELYSVHLNNNQN